METKTAPKKVLSLVQKLTQSLDPAAKSTGSSDENAPSWIKYVAMLTGVLAGLQGYLTVHSTKLTNEAIYESNQAILSQTQASDAWAEYQANSIKAHIVEMQLLPSNTLSAADKASLADMDKDLRSRQPQNKRAATDHSQEREAHLTAGYKKLTEKNLLDYASVAVQIGVALASVAALTRKPAAFAVAIAVALAGVAITLYAVIIGLG